MHDMLHWNAVLRCLNVRMFQILSKADSLSYIGQCYIDQRKIVHDFACLLEGYMQGIPEDSWHEFQIDCLNLVHRYRQQNQLFQQPKWDTFGSQRLSETTSSSFLAKK